ncbi:Ras-like protein family member 10B [Gryllus bimaculatus]|nr:Ras-like protein family member 10B [Gryllus bimaculatus]
MKVFHDFIFDYNSFIVNTAFAGMPVASGCVCVCVSELDLDALERGWRVRARPPPAALPSPSPDSMELVKLVLLGAPGVGKTSLVQQFVWNDFLDAYVPTERKPPHSYPSVIIKTKRLYEPKSSDIPRQSTYLSRYNSLLRSGRGHTHASTGCRSATATCWGSSTWPTTDSFQYIRALSRADLPRRGHAQGAAARRGQQASVD